MASLIPDVSGNLRINTVGAMNDYQAAMKNMRDAVASPGALIDKYLEREEKEKRAAEEQKRYETELGFKQRQEGRVVDELNRAQATREAVQAQLNPDMYRNSKLGEVDRAIEYGLSNLSPQDRAIAEQEIATNYNKNATGQYVLDRARTNEMVDPTVVLNAQSNQLGMRLKDPNSEEYKALLASEMKADMDKARFKHGLDMALNNSKFNNELKLYETKKEYDARKEQEAIDAESKLLTGNKYLKGNPYVDVLANPNATAIEKKKALEYAKSDLSNITKHMEEENKTAKEKEAKGLLQLKEDENKVYSGIPYTHEPKELLSYYEEWIKYGGTPKEFMNLIPNVDWNKPKDSNDGNRFDWGRVDPDLTNIRKVLDEAKKKTSPTTGTGKDTDKAPSSDKLLNFIGEDSTFLFPQKGYATLYDNFGR